MWYVYLFGRFFFLRWVLMDPQMDGVAFPIHKGFSDGTRSFYLDPCEPLIVHFCFVFMCPLHIFLQKPIPRLTLFDLFDYICNRPI